MIEHYTLREEKKASRILEIGTAFIIIAACGCYAAGVIAIYLLSGQWNNVKKNAKKFKKNVVDEIVFPHDFL